jgi:hypothetical protein
MSGFRFIHTGDIHLDSPLKGLAGQEGAAAERIRTATRAAFSNLIDAAITEEVAFVIIAGDLYDGDWRDYQTGLFFIKEMGRLARAHIPVFLVYGNHDAENQITKRLTLPDNVRAFSARKPETVRLGSSAFRLSTTAMAMSLAGSCFSTESAHWPFHHGIRRRGGTIFVATLPSAGPSGHANSPHPSSREGHQSTAWWSSSFLLSSWILSGFMLQLLWSIRTRYRQSKSGA